ncbi:MAG: FAD-linked oxidase C-terminal domain-containing protein [Opitutales bacterium]|nr:FAD-linked oxidase C-terminal domain-containing protein [Opitutales bacterium]
MNLSNLSKATTILKEQLGDLVKVSPNELFSASHDGLKVAGEVAACVQVEKPEEVGDVLKLASRFEIPVTTKGSGSSLTGGATPICGGWVLDLRKLDSLEVDEKNRVARCGPGVIVSNLQKEVQEVGLFYPPDPSSKDFCTIGGNIACNAGGLRCVKYGVTRDYVLALSGYLASGEKVTWGRATRKFATAYNVRDLWIGSEGTLGVVTEVTLRLIEYPTYRSTFLAAFGNDQTALSAPLALSRLNLRPSILEYMDKWTINCLQDYVGEKVFEGVPASPMLLIELDGEESEVYRQSKLLQSWMKENALAHRSAESEEEAERLWAVRRQGSSAMKKLATTKLNEDIVVPLAKQVELVAFVEELRLEFDLKIGVFGHCGDGNLHVNFMYNEEDADETQRSVKALTKLMSTVISLGGAISGEHGVGLAKTPFVQEQFNQAEWDAMLSIKKSLDPKGILNPGKIFEVFKPWETKKLKVDLPWET